MTPMSGTCHPPADRVGRSTAGAAPGGAPTRRGAPISAPAWTRAAARARPDARARVRGFTMVELLVVLLLLGLLAALAAPNLERFYAGLTRTSERDYILRQFAELGRHARQQGQAYVVRGGGARPDGTAAPGPGAAPGLVPYPIDLPEGWNIRLDRPLVVRASGACLGARLTLVYRTQVAAEVALAPPYCTVAGDG